MSNNDRHKSRKQKIRHGGGGNGKRVHKPNKTVDVYKGRKAA